MKKYRSQAETLKRVLAAPVPDEGLREELLALGLEGTYADAFAKALLDRAVTKADLDTAKFLRDVMGEKLPATAAGIRKSPRSMNLERLSDAELAALAE